MVNILFVCLGNICRSPMAEGIFEHLVKERALESKISWDSAGTSGFHAGEPADPRMMETARAHGIELTHRSRKLLIEDFSRFHYIISMDSANLDIILALQKKALQAGLETIPKVLMMRSFDPDANDADEDVPDPYYGGQDGFENVYQMLYRACDNFLDFLENTAMKTAKA
ncbi:MAG: low molecular weight phosphotyrosine protein phosphatase [Candidatus Kapabacteria bacterium]|nr:low molecular weight phosphotyrosine protein phosphatase [Candidatus Kapabacteria bacterium]